MRKLFLPLSILCLATSFFLFTRVKEGLSHSTIIASAQIAKHDTAEVSVVSPVDSLSNELYDSLHLDKMGLTREALLYAYKGHENLIEKGELSNQDILTVCDFTQPSTSKRMYIIDLKKYRVLMNTYVAHGKNSGLDYAENFSNAPESLESSLGFYITKNTYFGKHGLSLRLSGLDRGFNDNAESREVVVHGAQYVGDQRARSSYMGRSFGCPAVPQRLASKVISLIKNGTCLFIYHPSQSYILGSTILNG